MDKKFRKFSKITMYIYKGCWKNAGPTIQGSFVLKSRGKKNTRQNPTFNNNKNFFPWIGEQQYIKMFVQIFLTTLIYIIMLANCRSNISLYRC